MTARPEHQIIRQMVLIGRTTWHRRECTCGQEIAYTPSLATADRQAEYHLETASA